MYLTWFRMPEPEFDAYHRFRPYFILGQLDYTKEVLIPHKHEDGRAGFLVFNPLYSYEGGRTSLQQALKGNKDKIVHIERSGIILNRGWIPAELRDKRSRPEELNQRKLVKIRGVFRAGNDIHSYSAPNNPDNNEWNNLSLLDIGTFWDLPNYHEAQSYYFQAVDFCDGRSTYEQPGLEMPTKDEVIEDHYGWKLSERTNNYLFKGLGAVSAGLLSVAYMCI
jgi:cytochrome oxidase assembly protein ShyY1